MTGKGKSHTIGAVSRRLSPWHPLREGSFIEEKVGMITCVASAGLGSPDGVSSIITIYKPTDSYSLIGGTPEEIPLCNWYEVSGKQGGVKIDPSSNSFLGIPVDEDERHMFFVGHSSVPGVVAPFPSAYAKSLLELPPSEVTIPIPMGELDTAVFIHALGKFVII